MIIQTKLNDFFLHQILAFIPSGEEKEIYDTYSDEYQDIYAAIIKVLPDENKKLMSKIEELSCNIQNLMMKVAYKQGMKDGIELTKGVTILDTGLQLTLKKTDTDSAIKILSASNTKSFQQKLAAVGGDF